MLHIFGTPTRDEAGGPKQTANRSQPYEIGLEKGGGVSPP
jgi:hypothetical protein